MNEPIRFEDGAAYETFMGGWSRQAGERFLDWLAPPPDLDWIDVGCGNGAFTDLLVARCAPRSVLGVDPSAPQVAYARQRLPAQRFEVGDAQALPVDAASHDAAVMALVLFFVPDPAQGVAEMARVVRPGGWVGGYTWDLAGGGFPYAAIQEELAALGTPPIGPPSPEAASVEAMEGLWRGAGLVEVDTTTFEVRRRFDDVAQYWDIARHGPRIAPTVAGLGSDRAERLQARLRARFAPGGGGFEVVARANAVRGRVA